MDNTVNLLRIQIEKAKRELPLQTINAINAVDWRAVILGLRAKKGYNLEQLDALEIETELVLCGLASPKNYERELEKGMQINRTAANELVNEMNDSVFKKIREKLIENTERKQTFERNEKKDIDDTEILSSTGIKIIPNLGRAPETQPETKLMQVEKLELTGETRPVSNPEGSQEASNGIHPLLAQKLSGSFQIPVKETEHSLENITKTANVPVSQTSQVYPKNLDPYRLSPE